MLARLTANVVPHSAGRTLASAASRAAAARDAMSGGVFVPVRNASGYVHPLSEAVLDALRSESPPWLDVQVS